jgi:hypothetical protein
VFLRISIGLLLLAAAAPAAAQVYDYPPGGFAFTAPPGWEIQKEAAEPLPTLSGPKDDERAPYVVVNEAQGADIIALSTATVKEMLKSDTYQLQVRDSFFTADKQPGFKYVFVISTPLAYRQVIYFVEGPAGRIYTIIATLPEAGWKKYEPILDDMMRSYHLRPVVAAPPAPKPAATTPPAPVSSSAAPAKTDNAPKSPAPGETK